MKQRLEDQRLRVFADLDSLRGGQEWPAHLGEAVRRSRMMLLCWPARASVSQWVAAEIKDCLITRRQITPWLLDATPLPKELSRVHGITGADPVPVVNVAVQERRRCIRRRLIVWTPAGLMAGLATWQGWRLHSDRKVTFRGHVVDEMGTPVVGAAVEADGVRGETGADGGFRLALPGPMGRGLRVLVRKPGLAGRELHTQSDVPDLGVVLEKER